MFDFELIILCKRIIIDHEIFNKTLKDLPLYAHIHIQNKNTSKIVDIMYSYLYLDGEYFWESGDECDRDSVCSKCSNVALIRRSNPIQNQVIWTASASANRRRKR